VVSDGAHAEGFKVIRRYKDELAQQFRQVFGYRLVVESGFARLYKAGFGPGSARPLLRASGSPFTPRSYAYLALACAVLLTSRQQILLSELVVDIRLAAAEAGVEASDDGLTERRALVAALRVLVAWSVLVEDEGSVAAYADDPAAGVLLYVRRDMVRHLPAVPLREVDRPEELVRQAADPGPAGPRHAVRRRLVEEPVVMADDLAEDERAWLRQYQRREAQVLEDFAGLDLEIRAEGVAALDSLDDFSDIRFPREGTLGQAALLAVAELVARLRPERVPNPREATVPWVDVPDGLLEAVVAGLVDEHGRRWKRDYRDHPGLLARDVEDLLVDMGLLDRGGSTLRLRAVAARYAPDIDIVEADTSGQPPLDLSVGNAMGAPQ
jgi:uncharacterized protein (TIGR02678 family)